MRYSNWVEVGLGEESTVTGQVICCLRGAEVKLMNFGRHLFCVVRQFVAWVFAVLADFVLVLGFKVAPVRGVGRALQTPVRWLCSFHGGVFFGLIVDGALVFGLPVRRSASWTCHCLAHSCRIRVSVSAAGIDCERTRMAEPVIARG